MTCLIDSNSDSDSNSDERVRMTTITTKNRKIFSVKQVVVRLQRHLQSKYPDYIIIHGEITDLSYRGHLYLSLNSDGAILNMVAWKNVVDSFPKLRSGDSVMVEGKPDIYAPAGRLSFKIYKLDLKVDDIGDYQKMILKNESLCRKWGAFDAPQKKIPTICHKLAILTSIEGDAICDVLSVVRSNSLIQEIIIFDCKVQGKFASKSITDALNRTNQLTDIDAILLTRGGGSTDDLACFNDVDVLRAIHQSDYPIITAIGHKRDVSISDKISDYNAITPTDAGKYLSNVSRSDILDRLATSQDSLVEKHHQLMREFCRELDIRRNLFQLYSPSTQIEGFEKDYLRLQATLIDSVSHQISDRLHICENKTLYTTNQIDKYQQRLDNQVYKLLNAITQRKTKYTDEISHATNQIYQSNLSIVTDISGYTLDLSNVVDTKPLEAVIISNGTKHRVNLSIITEDISD